MTRPISAGVDTSALAHNLSAVKKYAPAARRLAVIKANAYGHGLLPVARALHEAEGFALLDIGDAILLREAGFRQELVLLEGFFAEEELRLAQKHSISVVVHSAEQLDMLEKSRLPGPVGVHLKLNSGMNRLGFRPEAYTRALSALVSSGKAASITQMTHFSTADEAEGVDRQLTVFRRFASPHYPLSLANSAAIIRYPQTHAEWVRPGIMLYGASPFAEISAASLGLMPAMTLASEIIAVQRVGKGEAVGYGNAFRADSPMRVGIVACGYADGYPRHAATGTPILVDGVRTRTLGRVSMDMLYADLTDLPDAGVGSKVILWGKGLPVEEVARASGTISYELLCALAPRVPVRYG